MSDEADVIPQFAPLKELPKFLTIRVRKDPQLEFKILLDKPWKSPREAERGLLRFLLFCDTLTIEQLCNFGREGFAQWLISHCTGNGDPNFLVISSGRSM